MIPIAQTDAVCKKYDAHPVIVSELLLVLMMVGLIDKSVQSANELRALADLIEMEAKRREVELASKNN